MGPSATLALPHARSQAGRSARSPIDHAYLARYTFSNAELEREVLGLFAGQAPQTLAWLVSAETPKAWRDAAHTLKGSARAVGALEVAKAAERAEGLAQSLDQGARDDAIAEITDALEIACEYIATLQPAA